MDRYVITASLKEIRSGTRSQWRLMSAGVMCTDRFSAQLSAIRTTQVGNAKKMKTWLEYVDSAYSTQKLHLFSAFARTTACVMRNEKHVELSAKTYAKFYTIHPNNCKKNPAIQRRSCLRCTMRNRNLESRDNSKTSRGNFESAGVPCNFLQ